jgi:phosphate transport system substrate-binding protein
MSIQRGRCNNLGLCQLATSQRVVELDGDEPFICPSCSADLTALPSRAAASGGKKLFVIQAAVILLGGAGIGYKLFTGATAPAKHAAVTASADVAPAATPDPAPAEHAAPAALAASAASAAPAATAAPPPAAPVPAVVPASTPAAAAPPPTILLRLAGSDVITGRLARRLAAGYLALIGDTDITTQPGAQPGTVNVVGLQAGQGEAIAIAQSSSTAGFNALLRGQADIALSVRPATTPEIESLAQIGDMTSPDAEHVAGVDAVAAIVNPAIRIGALTRAQLASILGGQIHNWSEVGAAPGDIHAYVRDTRNGDTPVTLLFADPAQARAAHTEADDTAVAAAVSHDAGGIGLVDMGAAGGARTLAIADAAAPLPLNDVTVATEDYPLTRRLYFYSATATAGGNNFSRRFTDYVASAAGQAAVEAAGFVSLSVKTQQAAVPQDASQRFRALVAGATRLSTTFRFQPGSTLLDSRAARDVDRLVAYLRSRHSDGAQLILAGFADNIGAASVSEAVSQKRVEAVVAALSRAGVSPGKAMGFGADVPVADNATADGREKNRRVEAYLAP